MKKPNPLVCWVVSALLVYGELPAQTKPDVSSFQLAGDAVRLGDQCIRLTEAVDWSSGSIWYKEPIRLDNPFEMELELFFGCKDASGADGMVFVFYPERVNLGYAGEGMGFAGLSPSLGIEIDTWLNDHLFDPEEDHIAILRDGEVNHISSLSGPARIKNVEDCAPHKLKVTWDPSGTLLRVMLDGREVIRYKGNLIKEIFRGRSSVYWGVTAATGRYNNRQEICFERLTFNMPAIDTRFDALTRKKLLGGEIFPLSNLSFESGQAQLPAESYAELDKVVRLLKENPKMSIEIFGHTDSSGDAGANQRISERRAQAVSQYLLQKGIPRNRVYFRGFGETYPIATNSTAAGRMKNRRVEIHFFIPVP